MTVSIFAKGTGLIFHNPSNPEIVIEKIKARYGDMPIYLAQISNMDFKLTYFADKTIYDLSPIQWLEYIKNAKFVYTDSYHGALFSIKYKKPFVAYYKNIQRAPRFIDLKERYVLQEHIVDNADDIDLNNQPNFDAIDEVILKHRIESIDFLNQSLI